METEKILKKYHAPWHIGFHSALKNLTLDQIKKLPEVQKEEHITKWKDLIWNENKQEIDQELLNICNLPEKIELLVPHWIMDRLKEALDQYVRGEWLSSLSLCGAIRKIPRPQKSDKWTGL